MDKDQLKLRIEELSPKAWSTLEVGEKHARLHELIMLYDQLIPLLEDTYSALESKTRIHMYLKEMGKAETCLRRILELWPLNEYAWILLSEVQFENGEFEKALESFDIGVKGSYSDFRFDFRAKINRALGRMEDAEKDQKIYDDYQAAEQAKWDDPNHYYHYK